MRGISNQFPCIGCVKFRHTKIVIVAWDLYEMETQNMLRMHEGKEVLLEKMNPIYD